MNVDYVAKRGKNQSEIEQYNNYKRVKVQMQPDNLYSEETQSDPRSRQCPYLDTINRFLSIIIFPAF
jgi:hypothetical protein